MIKKLMLVLIMSVLPLPPVAIADDGGFRGLKWGAPLSETSGMRHAFDLSTNGYKVYQRDNDILQVGEAKVKYILYAFWNDKLSYVTIVSKDPLSLLKSCTAKWGPPLEISRYEYEWKDGDTGAYLKFKVTEAEGRLRIFSHRIEREAFQAPASTAGF